MVLLPKYVKRVVNCSISATSAWINVSHINTVISTMTANCEQHHQRRNVHGSICQILTEREIQNLDHTRGTM